MSRKSMTAVLIISAIGIVFASLSLKRGHDFSDRECFNCHQDPFGRNAKLLTKPVTRLCRQCHSKVISIATHPYDIKPLTVEVPADMPLRDGMLACSTCHDIHKEEKRVFGAKTFYLRRPAQETKFFCASCHREDPDKPGHLLLPLAHMAKKLMNTKTAEVLDPLSLECIGCHDGSIAQSDIMIKEQDTPDVHASGMHPVGVSYREAGIQGAELMPIGELDKRIRFVKGKISCITCHDLYSSKPKKLVMSNSQSMLCRSCHYDK